MSQFIKIYKEYPKSHIDEIEEWFEYPDSKIKYSNILGLYKIEAAFDNLDGGGPCQMVRKITCPDGTVEYIRVYGFYSSYRHTVWYFDKAETVRPIEVIKIDYEKC